MILKEKRDKRGFTLIEILIVVTIIGILAAITIPAYLGIQERSKKVAVIRAASASESELQAWLHSSRKAGVGAGLIETDTDGNGIIDSSDSANSALSAAGVCNVYVNVQNVVKGLKSPWDNGVSLWNTSSGNGQIVCIMIGSSSVSVVAKDRNGYDIHMKTIYSD